MYFLIEDDDFLKNIILFGIKSALILRLNLKKIKLIANLSAIREIRKPKLNLMVMKLQSFMLKKFLR